MRRDGMDSPAHRIQRRRSELGLTQADACRLGGLAPATWRAVESGTSSRPRPRTKVRIARALATTPSSIWPQQPPPLHLHDTDDPRWERAVQRLARRLSESGTPAQRRSFGERLIGVLDCADRGAPHPAPGATRWERLWQIGGELAGQPSASAIAIVDGKLLEAPGPIAAPPGARARPGAGEIVIRRGGASARRGRPPEDC